MQELDRTVLEQAISQSFNAVVITDADFDADGPHIVYCNPAFLDMTGYPWEELKGRSPRLLQGPDTDQAVIQRLRQSLLEGTFFEGSTVNYRRDGTPYHVQWNVSPIRDDNGDITGYVSLQQNISREVEAERIRDVLSAALNESNDPILITDERHRIVFVNDAFQNVSGYRAEELIGNTPRLMQSGEHDAAFYRDLDDALSRGNSFRAVFVDRRKAGDTVYLDQSIAPIRDQHDRITHFISIAKDVSDTVMREKELSDMAERDALTGLLNRRAGDRVLAAQQQADRDDGRPWALILCDIDHFKQVNDRYGHPAGDRVLCQVADVLRNHLRDSDTVIRWGGEEFMVILPDTDGEEARQSAERIREAIHAAEFPETGSITMSFGTSVVRPGDDSESLVSRADQALYRAKEGGRDRVEED